MARTHTTVSLDRQGRPISPQAFARPTVGQMSGNAAPGPGIEPVPELPPLSHYALDIKRDIETWELGKLVDMWLKANGHAHGLSLRLAPEAYAALDGNMRRHFRAQHKSSA